MTNRLLPVRFLVVPQWQGTGSSRALQLRDGAEAIRDDLPASKTTVVEVPLGAGEGLGSGIRRFTSVQFVRDRTLEVLAEHALDGEGATVVAIGGDCGIELATIGSAYAAADGDVAVVWFDAHPDLNTPESSPSGAFHGMVLRTLLGDGYPTLVPDRPVEPRHVVLAGVRALDDAEADFVDDAGIRMISPSTLTPDTVVKAITATGASRVYLHIDLDVLDPAEFGCLGFPEPFGVSAAMLIDTIRAIVKTFPLAGAGITEFAPSSPEAAADDLPTILRIIGALTS
ncbi:MAG: arginase family protein [Terrimesophilobacter sp.]